MRSLRSLAGVALLVAGLAGCATVANEPRNKPVSQVAQAAEIGREDTSYDDDLLVAISFSGGGTRAAAFAHGALIEFERTRVPARDGPASLLDKLDFVSGVSGGSVTAAYYGLKKRAALADFREKFLLRNAEEAISTDITLSNISKALGGGINDTEKFPRWLDANLFEGATFNAFRVSRRPRIWINASDIYNRTTFVFGATAFRAICSDLNSFSIADAVAASAAVPVLFAPVVIKAYPGQCNSKLPDWIVRARDDHNAPPMLHNFAEAISRYNAGEVPYIKLLDGGLVDNFGLSGFTIARLSSETPYGPMTQAQAVKLRRALFIVVDAGRGHERAETVDREHRGGEQVNAHLHQQSGVEGEQSSAMRLVGADGLLGEQRNHQMTTWRSTGWRRAGRGRYPAR